MGKKIRLTENDIKNMVFEAVTKRLNLREFDEPAGFDDNSEDYGGMNRDGSIESVCKGKFNTKYELKMFIEDLMDVIGMDEMSDKINERIDFISDEEGKVTGW